MVLSAIKIYMNNAGTLQQTIEAPIYRLSNNVNIIHLIAPFPRLSVMRINFLLANNQTIMSKPMTLLDETEIVTVDGTPEVWNKWEYFMDSATLAVCATLKSSPLYVSFVETEISWYDGSERKDASDPAYYGLYQNTTMLELQRQYKIPELEDWAIVVYTNEGLGLNNGEAIEDWLQHYIYKYNLKTRTILDYETYDEIKAYDDNTLQSGLSFEYVREDELEDNYVAVFNITNSGSEATYADGLELRFYRNDIEIHRQMFTSNTVIPNGTTEIGLSVQISDVEEGWVNSYIKADIESALVKKTSMVRLDVQPSIPAPNEEVIISATDIMLEQVVVLNQLVQQLQVQGGIENIPYVSLGISNPSAKSTNDILVEVLSNSLPYGARVIAPTFVANDLPSGNWRAIINIVSRNDSYVLVELVSADTANQRHFYIKNATSVSGWLRYATTADVASSISTHNTSNEAHSDIRTSVSNITNGISLFKKIKFDVDSPAETLAIGEMRWADSYSDTPEVRLNQDVTLQLGEETLFKARASQNIANGQAVYISAGQGASPVPIVSLATNVGNGAASKCLGIATEDINTNNEGFITIFGRVNDINTNSWEVGDILYLGTSGNLTNVEPTPPARTTIIGYVVRKHSNDGAILVVPRCYPFLYELSDMNIISIANGDIVRWNETTNVWENFNIDTALGLKVDKVTGYALSQNDFTNALKSKLDGIEESADVNIIEGVVVDGVTLTPNGSKLVTIPVANISTQKDGLITWEEKQQIENNTTSIQVLQGAKVIRGNIDNSTAQIVANKALLTSRINTLLSRTPIQGDVLIDNDKNEWYYAGATYTDDTKWDNLGQNIIGNAGNSVYGLVKSSTDITYTNGEGVVNQATKVKQVLTVGAKTYDGSVAVEIVTADVGAEPANANIQSHISDTNNPHSVDKTDVGLGNVDNTSDANKPVSTLQATAIGLKIDKDFSTYDNATVDDTDLMIFGESGVAKKATVGALKSHIISTSGEFDPSVDYGASGLGAYSAEIIKPKTRYVLTRSKFHDITGSNAVEVLAQSGLVKNARIKSIKGWTLNAPQLVTNGTFDTNLTGWTVVTTSPTWVSGRAFFERLSGGALVGLTQTILNTTNKFYLSITLDKIVDTANAIYGAGTTSLISLDFRNAPMGESQQSMVFSPNANLLYFNTNTGGTTYYLDNVYVCNISSLITTKQYSPLFNTTFDLMSDANIKTQMDEWVLNGTLPKTIKHVNATKLESISENLLPELEVSGSTLIATVPVIYGKANVGYKGTPTSIALTYKTKDNVTISTETISSFSGTTYKYANFTIPTNARFASVVITPSETINTEFTRDIEAFMKLTHVGTTATGNTNATIWTPYSKDTLSLGYTLRSAFRDFGGYSLVNKITNGDFSSGTTGWIAASDTSINSDNVVLNIVGTGTGTQPRAYQAVSYSTNKIYVLAKMRVTNNLATNISIRDNVTIIAEQTTPTINQWYNISGIRTFTSGFLVLRSSYTSNADANTSILQVDYVIAVNLTELYTNGVIPSIPTTAAEFEAMIIQDEIDLESYNLITRVDSNNKILATPTYTPITLDNDYTAHNFGLEVFDGDLPPISVIEYPIDVVNQANTNTEKISEQEKQIEELYEEVYKTIEQVYLSDSVTPLTKTSKAVTIPNVVATGVGETDGLMTHEDKTRLDGMATGSQVNVLEGIIVDGDTLSITSKKSTIPVANSTTEKDGLITWEEKVLIASHETKLNAMAGAYIYRGVISQTQPTQQQLTDRIDALLSRTPILGDVLLDLNGVEWYYDGTNWLNMGQNIIGVASSSVLGIVKLNYTENGNNKKVRIDGNNDVYVTIPDVSNDTQGLMPTAYKVKLDNIQTLVSWALFFGTQVINKTSQYSFTTDMLRLKNAYLEIDTSEGVLMTNINGNGAFSGTQEGITYEVESTSSGFSFTYVDGTPASITINEIRFYPFGSQ